MNLQAILLLVIACKLFEPDDPIYGMIAKVLLFAGTVWWMSVMTINVALFYAHRKRLDKAKTKTHIADKEA